MRDDYTNRKVVIDTLDRTFERYKAILTEAYDVLPSVDPQEPESKIVRALCVVKPEALEKYRRQIIEQMREGAVLLPNWIELVDEEPKTGHWINDNGIYKCTVCNDHCTVAGWADCIPKGQMYKEFKYCPICGARMESEDKE